MNELKSRTVKLRIWSDAELEVIQNTRELPAEEVAELLDGRSRSAVENKRFQLDHGWTPKRSVWTEEELAIVRQSAGLTAEELSERLPGRSAGSAKQMRLALGVKTLPRCMKRVNQIGNRTLVARTCIKCGLLLPGDWFNSGPKKVSHQSQCVSCRRAGQKVRRDRHLEKKRLETGRKSPKSNDKYQKAQQEMTVKHATRSFVDYTEADYAVLSRPDMTLLEKALTLRRSFYAVKQRCGMNGFKSLHGKGDPSKSQWIIDNPNADNIEVIAELIQRANSARDETTWDWDE